MAVRQYIGARYVPRFYENSLGTSEWQAGVEYEPLTIVTYNSNSYTSKKTVPSDTGNPSANPDYWAATGNYNAQVEEYRQEVEDLRNQVKGMVVNVKDYGAIGDGSTDDTSAINAAIAVGTHIYFPQGTYLVTSPLMLHDNMEVIGERGAVVKGMVGGSDYIFDGTSVNNLIFTSFKIDAANDSRGGIRLQGGNNVVIEKMEITGTTGYNPIQFYSTDNVYIIDNYIHDVEKDALAITHSNGGVIAGNIVEGFKDTGIVVTQSDDVSVTGNVVKCNNAAAMANTQGIAVSRSRNVSVNGNAINASESISGTCGVRIYNAEDALIYPVENSNIVCAGNTVKGLFNYSFVIAQNCHMILIDSNMCDTHFGIYTGGDHVDIKNNFISSDNNAILIMASATGALYHNVIGNTIGNPNEATAEYGIRNIHDSEAVITGNVYVYTTYTLAALQNAAGSSRIYNNAMPATYYSTPSLPSSGVNATNNNEGTYLMTFSGGAITKATVDGIDYTGGVVAIVIPPWATFSVTYTTAPTWHCYRIGV